MDSVCPACGSENRATDARCEACGQPLSIAVNASQAVPFRWKWTGLFAGLLTAVILVGYLAPGINNAFLRFELPRTSTYDPSRLPWRPPPDIAARLARERRPIEVQNGLGGTGALLGVILFGGAAFGLVSRQSIGRELAVGGVGLVLVQWAIWAMLSDWRLGQLLGSPVVVRSASTTLIQAPPVVFFALINALTIMLPAVAASLVVSLWDGLVGKATCKACGHRYAFTPSKTLCCPRCATPPAHALPNWRWVAIAVGATSLAFFLVPTYLGPTLGFYWSCDFNSADLSASCKQGYRTYRDQRDHMSFWGPSTRSAHKPYPAVVVQHYSYVGYLTLLFFVGPFLIGWRCRRRALKTGATTLLLNCLAAVIIATTLLGFGRSPHMLIKALQFHLLACLAWAATGAVGLWLGRKLAPTSNLFTTSP